MTSPTLSTGTLENRDDYVFFPTSMQEQGNVGVNTAIVAELDRSSEIEQISDSERLSELELDLAAEQFLAALNQEYETRKREVEEAHRRNIERLEQRQKVGISLLT